MAFQAKRNQNSRPAAMALIVILIVFCVTVSRGWQAFFASTGEVISIVLGLAVSVIAAILAYATANERVQSPAVYTTAVAYFFLLFNISALGTANALFVTFQSGNIFHDSIRLASTAFLKLQNAAFEGLSAPEYDQFDADVNSAWEKLKAEIENPLFCGEGTEANRRIEDLQRVLKEFRPLNRDEKKTLRVPGGCDGTDFLVRAYSKQIDTLRHRSPEYLKAKAILETRNSVKEVAERNLQELTQLENKLGIAPDIQAVKTKLFSSAEEYSRTRTSVVSVLHKDLPDVPDQIDVAVVSAIGDVGQLIPFLILRFKDISTYIYLVLAISLDVILIAAFKRVLSEKPPAGQQVHQQKIKHL